MSKALLVPLDHEIKVIDSMLKQDSMILLSNGLAEIQLALLFLATSILHHKDKPNHPLILFLGLSNQDKFQTVVDRANQMRQVFRDLPFTYLGPDSLAKDRENLMAKGGVFASTSRTFVVDFLNSTIPTLDGILVFQAHR